LSARACGASPRSRLTRTRAASSAVTGRRSRASKTSAPSAARHSRAARARTSSLADFHARTSRTPAGKLASPGRDRVCGRKCSASFARFDRRTSSWRMSRRYARGASTAFSVIWPRAGTTRNGTACQRQPLVPLTSVTASSLWPTPGASDGHVLRFSNLSIRRNLQRGHQRKIVALLRLSGVGNAVIPNIYEWAMGLPARWTDCGAAATPFFRRRRSGSANSSSRSTRHDRNRARAARIGAGVGRHGCPAGKRRAHGRALDFSRGSSGSSCAGG
jgi:hypothetical protein